MNRHQLEHVLRASGNVSGCREIVILGSQAILGAFPTTPADLLSSMEVDLYPLEDPDKADLIDGCLGELMKENRFPEGWDENRVKQVLAHYEAQSEEEAMAEDEAAWEDHSATFVKIPEKLLSRVRELLAKTAM